MKLRQGHPKCAEDEMGCKIGAISEISARSEPLKGWRGYFSGDRTKIPSQQNPSQKTSSVMSVGLLMKDRKPVNGLFYYLPR
jgi:hypothetical protein